MFRFEPCIGHDLDRVWAHRTDRRSWNSIGAVQLLGSQIQSTFEYVEAEFKNG